MAKRWVVKWKTHEIAVENAWFGGEKLHIDGKCCDTGKGLNISRDLRGQITEADGATHIVTAKLRQGSLGLRVVCHVLVDDAWVGGDPV